MDYFFIDLPTASCKPTVIASILYYPELIFNFNFQVLQFIDHIYYDFILSLLAMAWFYDLPLILFFLEPAANFNFVCKAIHSFSEIMYVVPKSNKDPLICFIVH